MVNLENIKLKFSKTSDVIIKTAAVVGALTVIAGGYTFYLNYIWKPTVTIVSVDFTTGTAKVVCSTPLSYFDNSTTTINIYGSNPFSIGGAWAIQFGSTIDNGKSVYNSLQLTKTGMIVEYLNESDPVVAKAS